ncbi:hypothetical protein DFH08DRAFT_200862 [Mycena albidolilacea]|uniref:Uncharacterized protein n=1 Tax=Mycena albidolilacea TaxID=1033008 RepID=A0AAD7EQU4_9AGAR|nr:hypothetical protein DFH08DRAFT_200862 [Mycena albidolilacea]
MISRVFTTAILVASSVSALTISSACQNALTQVATNSDASACLSVSSLLGAVLQSNTSIITPVDNWLKSLCSAAPCSNATLSAVITNVTTGCSAELSLADGSEASAATLIPLVEQYYPTARKIVCLTDSGTNCITQTLTNIQSILGTLSISNIGTIIANAVTTTNLPSNVTCSNCVKEAYNVLNTDFPSAASSLTSDLNNQCGANFTDGSKPTGIVESAKTTDGNNNSGQALTVTHGAFAGSALVVASYLWVLLA